MRTLLLALLVLLPAHAFAQTIGTEISSGPLPFTSVQSFLPAPAVAVAKDRTGVAIAWVTSGAGGDRISVVRLDVTGHFTGQVQTIPAASADSLYALAPSLAAAPRGDGFTLAWLEMPAVQITRAAYCRLDRDLKPTTPSVLITLPNPPTTPAIVRSRKTTWISAGGSAWELRDDGSISEPLNAGFNATDMTVATDFPQLVASGRVVTGGLICPPGCASGGGHFPTCGCPLAPITSSALLFTSLYSVSTSKTLDTDTAPAIGSDGHDVVVAWLPGAHVKGGQVVMSRLLPSAFGNFSNALDDSHVIGSFGGEGGATRPDIASDGERYVIVWRTALSNGSHDIVGASMDRAGNIIPLSIATSAADERDPSVIAMGDGTFLIAYEKFSDGQRQIAGRIVTFQPRSHAVR